VSAPWSDDARVMVRPFRTYAELATARDEEADAATRSRLALRIGLILLTLAGFVSLSAAGRLVAFHVASSMVAWSFVPLAQAAAFALTLRLVARDRRVLPALELYFTGHAPWLVFLLSLAGVCLFAPDVYAVMSALLAKGVLPALMLVTIVWSAVITFACLRAGVGLPRGRAAGATALFYGLFSSAILGWYLALNEIQPQAPWAQR
jgi:hypothetical protein